MITKEGETDTNVCPTSCLIRLGLRLQDYSLFGAADLSCAESTALLEAFAAKHRTSLRGAEGDSSFLSTLGARRLCFRAHLGGSAASTTAFSALGLASLASLW